MSLFKALAHRALLWGLRAPRLAHSVMPEGPALPGQHIRPVWIEGEGGQSAVRLVHHTAWPTRRGGARGCADARLGCACGADVARRPLLA